MSEFAILLKKFPHLQDKILNSIILWLLKIFDIEFEFLLQNYIVYL